MSSRKSNDNSSQNGVAFQSGNPVVSAVKNVNYSQFADTGRLLVKNGAFNGHAVEVWADGGVWDTISGKFLFPGTDYNVHDVQRS